MHKRTERIGPPTGTELNLEACKRLEPFFQEQRIVSLTVYGTAPGVTEEAVVAALLEQGLHPGSPVDAPSGRREHISATSELALWSDTNLAPGVHLFAPLEARMRGYCLRIASSAALSSGRRPTVTSRGVKVFQWGSRAKAW